MNLILSGVLVPLLLVWPEAGGDKALDFGLAVAMVVILVAFVVSAKGGGGRLAMSGNEVRTCAVHRKHSPLP